MTARQKLVSLISRFLAELPTKYTAAQGHALVSYFGSSRSGKVLTRSAKNLNNFLKDNSALFPGYPRNKKTYKVLRSLWYRYDGKFFDLRGPAKVKENDSIGRAESEIVASTGTLFYRAFIAF